MKLFKSSSGTWHEVACPGGGVPYEAIPKEKYAEVEAALAGAEKALEYSRKRIAGKKQHDVIDKALAQIRAAKEEL